MKRPLLPALLAAVLLLAGIPAPAEYQSDRQPDRAQKASDRKSDASDTPLSVGDYAWVGAETRLPGLDGSDYSLSHWKGKVILFNFWASWCSPCQYEIPKLVELQEKYGVDGLQIVGIGMDKEIPLRNVSRTLGINYPVLVADNAAGQKLLDRWGNTAQIVPYNVVIEQDGRISYVHAGVIDHELFGDHIAPLLKKSNSTH